MNRRDVEGLLDRWQGRGLISPDLADAIRAYEAEELADEFPAVDEPTLDVGALLSYGGALVALGAIVGLYATLFDDLGSSGKIPVTWGVATAAAALAWLFSRARGGSAAADATGFAATILVAWAVIEVFNAAGWFMDRTSPGREGYYRDVAETRIAWMVSSAVVAAAGYGLARYRVAPMAALSAAVALIWIAATLGGWIGQPSDDGPGAVGSQFAVIVAIVLAAVALLHRLYVEERAALWWLIGSLGAMNVAAVFLSGEEGGAYEALLLAYAIGLAIVAVVTRRKVILVFAALFLYEWVGFVVFRTFEGAVAAIIVTALVGLGTAIGGIGVQRGLIERLYRLRGPRGTAGGGDSAS